jgi:hypothetical protein
VEKNYQDEAYVTLRLRFSLQQLHGRHHDIVGRYEIFIRKYLAQSIKREQNKNATHKTKKMSNSDLAKETAQGAGVVKSKQFLFLRKHPLCYSWSGYL